jgi:hypothetical protein
MNFSLMAIADIRVSKRLVATLGYKSNLKRVTRRAILDVNLPKACKTITEPEMPLALRLQGSLL